MKQSRRCFRTGGARLPRWWLGGRGSTGRGPLRSTDSTTSSTSSSKSLSASLSLGGGDQPEATPRVDSPSQKGSARRFLWSLILIDGHL